MLVSVIHLAYLSASGSIDIKVCVISHMHDFKVLVRAVSIYPLPNYLKLKLNIHNMVYHVLEEDKRSSKN